MEVDFLLGQNSILELIANGAPLSQILESIVRLLESQLPGSICSILRADETGQTLRLAAGNRLPKSLASLCHSVPIHAALGTCGKAALFLSNVFTKDLWEEPSWQSLLPAISDISLRSCWSIPIRASRLKDSGRDILGTFAWYTEQPMLPTESLELCLERAGSLARIAIEAEIIAKEVRDHDERFKIYFNQTNQPMMLHDLEGTIVDANASACEQFQCTKEQLIGRPDIQFDSQCNQERRDRIRENHSRGESTRFITFFQRDDGTHFPVDVRLTPYRFRDISWSVSTWVDLSKRTAEEQELRWRNEGLGILNDAATSILSAQQTSETLRALFSRVASQIGCTAYVNYVLEDGFLVLKEFSGLPDFFVAKLSKLRMGEYLCGQYAALGQTLYVDYEEIRDSQELFYLRDIGIKCYCGVPLKWNDQLLGGISFCSSIREQLNASDLELIEAVGKFVAVAIMRQYEQEQLQRSEERLRDLANAMPQIVWACDETGRINYGNQLAVNVLGETGCSNWDNVIHPEDRAQVVERWTEAISQGIMYECEHRLFDLTRQEYRWYFARAVPARDAQGNIFAWYGAASDIHKVKQSEAALRLSEEEFRALFDAANAGMCQGNLQGQLLRVNDAFCSLLGYSSEELLGRNLLDFVVDEQRCPLHDEFARLAGNAIEEFQIEQAFRTKLGNVIYVHCFIKSVAQGPLGKDSVIAVFIDLTAKRRLEEQVRLSQKMEALGRLAGGVAHDFNNVLTVILGTSELVLLQAEIDDQLRENISMIHDAASRAAGLTRQLLTFGRKQIVIPKVVDCNEIIRRVEPILHGAVGRNARLDLRLTEDSCRIHIDPIQLEQILVNLVFNARDALPHGGLVKISTQVIPFPEEFRNRPSDLPAWVQIAVSDNGSGIPAHDLPSIFEPFFTTKEVGKGSGLGLAVVHSIVEQNEGRIRVETMVGKGTTFFIEFPTAAESSLTEDIRHKDPRLDETEGTILIVDDEPGICEIAARSLLPHRIRTLIANGPQEALDILQKHGHHISLMLTDIQMPFMNGEQLAKEAQRIQPNLRVIFMTGFSPYQNSPDNHGRQTIPTLMKPFNQEGLLRMVRLHLNASAPEPS